MNRYEQRSIKAYDKKAYNYENTFDGKLTKKFKALLLEKIIVNKGSNLLDVACGNGGFLKSVSKKSMFNGFGIDISPNMIDYAKELNQDMEFSVSSCEKTLFQNDFFDIITVCASFHHFPNIYNFAEEMKRITKKNGIIYIAEIYLPLALRIIANHFVKYSNAGDVKFYSPDEIVNCFEKFGFAKKEIMIEKNIQIVSLYKL